jgi:transcriptional regulator with PAS, ATPase and Fis domain
MFADRTISRTGFDRLSGLPSGTEAVLLDESPEMAARMVAALLQMGLRHLRLSAASAEDPGACEGKTAIILGESGCRPLSPKEIVNIGSSLLDLSTIIDLGIRLDLDHRLNRQNIRESYREIVTVNAGLAKILDKTNRFESSLDILLQVIDSGVIGVKADGRVFSCNEKAKRIMGLGPEDLVGADGAAAFPQLPLGAVLETRAPVKELLVKIGGYDVVCSADPILHSGLFYGAVAVLDRFSEEERKQHRLRARLIGKGYRAKHGFEDICALSASMNKCKDIARRMADSNSSILISGESGTGKEMLAQAIHNGSGRGEYQFVAVNCGALPESLLESELFGYEEGAFTGARKGGKPGLFELAHRGTLFLDEIGEMPLALQMRFLRVLEEREVMRLGSDRLIDVDMRVVAATNRNLKEMVAKGSFRQDLFYRLNVLPLLVPPLCERPEDIMPLVRVFQRSYDSAFEVSPAVEALFLRHRFRGNARELRNYVEFVANLGIKVVEIEDLPFEFEDKDSGFVALPGESGSALLGEEDSGARLFILRELEKAYQDRRRMGRRSLFELARERRLFISEQEIRSVLKDLEMKALVEIRPGKSGTLITPLGRSILDTLKAEVVSKA